MTNRIYARTKHTYARFLGAPAFALGLALSFAALHSAQASDQDYRFELAGQPQAANGKDTVQVKLIHVADNKPVIGAVIFQSHVDMGPGMEAMSAPIVNLPENPPGIYSFSIAPGLTGNWEIYLSAKVQGQTQTVHGTLTANLVH
jgi:hypothetical protein